MLMTLGGAPEKIGTWVVEVKLRRARVAVGFYFALTGIVLAVWAARIPSIKAQLGLSESELSLCLFTVAIGAVLAMQVAGRLVDRYGSRKVTLPAGVLLGLSLIAPSFMPNLPSLAFSLVFLGLGHGLVDVAMNTHAIELERLYQRPIMSSFHAVFSLGGLAGAGIGALAAAAGVSVSTTFVMTSLFLAVLAVLAGRWLIRDIAASPSNDARSPEAAPRNEGDEQAVQQEGTARQATVSGETSRRWSKAVVFLGLLSFSCLFGEGAVTDWSSTFLHESLGSSVGVAPLGYAAFAIAMAAGRLSGDRLALRLGPVRLVRGCGILAGLGLGAGLVLGDPVSAIVGFGVFGLGLSCIVPQIFTAAGNRDPKHSGSSVAQVASIGYLGLLVGPVLIGPLAELFGLRVVMALPVVLAFLVAACAVGLHPRGATTAALPS